MSKYIDVEKLKTEVNKLRQDWLGDSTGLEVGEAAAELGAAESILDSFDDIIDSLQQEQSDGLHFTPLNRLIQKIPSKNWNDTVNNYAKKLRDCLIEEGYLKDAEVLQDYISYMNGNNVPMATMDEQEQPKVDLEKEVASICETYGITNHLDAELGPLDIRNIAHHFYELYFNARKEE